MFMSSADEWQNVSLEGVMDLHVHTAPDVRPRWHTALEMGALAEQAGMAGFVLKNHHRSTVELAAEVRRNHRLKVYGGLVLNRAAGGLDPGNVRAALEAGARFIWLPTQDGCGECLARGQTGLAVVDHRQRVVRELEQILELIAHAHAVLATGHIAAHEVEPLVRAARRAGVNRILVNHPEIPFLRFGVDLQKRLRDEGALLERCYPRPEAVDGFEQIAQEARAVGVAHTVLATDLGRRDLPSPLDGFRALIQAMMARGFSAAEVAEMTCHTPLRLVGADASSPDGAPSVQP
jgi:hypothetical protein